MCMMVFGQFQRKNVQNGNEKDASIAFLDKMFWCWCWHISWRSDVNHKIINRENGSEKWSQTDWELKVDGRKTKKGSNLQQIFKYFFFPSISLKIKDIALVSGKRLNSYWNMQPKKVKIFTVHCVLCVNCEALSVPILIDMILLLFAASFFMLWILFSSSLVFYATTKSFIETGEKKIHDRIQQVHLLLLFRWNVNDSPIHHHSSRANGIMVAPITEK